MVDIDESKRVFSKIIVSGIEARENGVADIIEMLYKGVSLYQGEKKVLLTGLRSVDKEIGDEEAQKWFTSSSNRKSFFLFLRPDVTNVVADDPKHYELHFAQDSVRLYVLLPNNLSVPEWLQRDFMKLNVVADCDWHLHNLPWYLKMIVPSRQLEHARETEMEVWMSFKRYSKGEDVFLGGSEGRGSLFEWPYVLVFRRESDAPTPFDEDLEEAQQLVKEAQLKSQPLRFKNAAWTRWKTSELEDMLQDWVRNPSKTMLYEKVLLIQVLLSAKPLACISGILFEMTLAIRARVEFQLILKDSFQRFKSLETEFLRRLEDFADLKRTQALSELFEPSKPDSPLVEDFSPWECAFTSNNADFMSCLAVRTYVHQRWRGLAFASVSIHSDISEVHNLSPMMLYTTLRTWGLIEPASTDAVMRIVSKYFHYTVLASRPYFESPRGRWLLHSVSELLFLILYNIVVFYPDWQYTEQILYPLALYYLGQLFDTLVLLRKRFKMNLKAYFMHRFPFNMITVPLNLILFALTCAKLAQRNGNLSLSGTGVDWIQVSMSTCAFFVWFRAMGAVVVPISPSVASQLNVMYQMATEVAAFLFPLMVFFLGFASNLDAVFSSYDTDYDNIYISMLTLFQAMVGNPNFTDFANNSDLPTSLQIYGSIMLVMFCIMVGILLLTLLIAIMSHCYNPESFEMQAVYNSAEIREQYMFQVRNSLVCSPFNLLELPLKVLFPDSRRKKISNRACQTLLLPPLDGFAVPNDRYQLLRTGCNEFPYLIFLLTVYPVMTMIVLVLYLLCTPFAVAYFALTGFKKMMKEMRKSSVSRKPKSEGGPKSPGAERSSIFKPITDRFSPSRNQVAPEGEMPNIRAYNGVGSYKVMPPPQQSQGKSTTFAVLSRIVMLIVLIPLGTLLYALLGALLGVYVSYVFVAKVLFCLRNFFRSRQVQQEAARTEEEKGKEVLLNLDDLVLAVKGSRLSDYMPMVNKVRETKMKMEELESRFSMMQVPDFENRSQIWQLEDAAEELRQHLNLDEVSKSRELMRAVIYNDVPRLHGLLEQHVLTPSGAAPTTSGVMNVDVEGIIKTRLESMERKFQQALEDQLQKITALLQSQQRSLPAPTTSINTSSTSLQHSISTPLEPVDMNHTDFRSTEAATTSSAAPSRFSRQESPDYSAVATNLPHGQDPALPGGGALLCDAGVSPPGQKRQHTPPASIGSREASKLSGGTGREQVLEPHPPLHSADEVPPPRLSTPPRAAAHLKPLDVLLAEASALALDSPKASSAVLPPSPPAEELLGSKSGSSGRIPAELAATPVLSPLANSDKELQEGRRSTTA